MTEQHRPLHDLTQRLKEHHDRVVHEREEQALQEAAEQAGFDLETDLGHPLSHPGGDAFDMELDLGTAQQEGDD